MSELLSSTALWLGVSITCYALGCRLQQKTGSPLCNPLLIAAVLVGALLVLTGTSYTVYNQAGRLIAFFLTPATVSLALPIYRKLDVLRRNLLPILAGAFVGSLTSTVSVIGFSRLFGLSPVTTRSLIPKSVTSAIGVALSEMLGGLAPLTAISIVFTGIFGAIILPAFLRSLGVTDPVQTGLSIGTAAHSVGTSRAIQLGETEGAMSGLAIGVAGLFTALLVSAGSAFLG